MGSVRVSVAVFDVASALSFSTIFFLVVFVPSSSRSSLSRRMNRVSGENDAYHVAREDSDRLRRNACLLTELAILTQVQTLFILLGKRNLRTRSGL